MVSFWFRIVYLWVAIFDLNNISRNNDWEMHGFEGAIEWKPETESLLKKVLKFCEEKTRRYYILYYSRLSILCQEIVYVEEKVKVFNSFPRNEK